MEKYYKVKRVFDGGVYFMAIRDHGPKSQEASEDEDSWDKTTKGWTFLEDGDTVEIKWPDESVVRYKLDVDTIEPNGSNGPYYKEATIVTSIHGKERSVDVYGLDLRLIERKRAGK